MFPKPFLLTSRVSQNSGSGDCGDEILDCCKHSLLLGLEFSIPSFIDATDGRVAPGNGIFPVFDSTTHKHSCDFLKGHFRVVPELDDESASFQFGFVGDEASIFL